MALALMAAQAAKKASVRVARASDALRRRALLAAADRILADSEAILAANARDMERARQGGMSAALLDRLALDDGRIEDMASSLREIAGQADPLHRIVSGHTLESGLRMEQVTVPMGVVAMIYEARPNVTVDSFALCLRSGNACVLKGGSAARESCVALASSCCAALEEAGLPSDALCYVDSTDHAETEELMRTHGYVDVLIPRGGASLIRACVDSATVPTIETGTGNCHVYLDAAADPAKIVPIVINAKTSRPGTCNSIESLLVDASAAEQLLCDVLPALHAAGVELCGDERVRAIACGLGVPMEAATEEDYATEYLALKMSVCCVSGVGEAVEHINRYGTGHSEAVITEDYAVAEAFVAGVDAAAVYVNASTRFTDGGVFGLGGEIGISTQKLHARGPMGAAALTTTKYILRGEGQVR
ncbi:glutamate-5-semialdehyde dehydrogenase [Coriobacteriales bacterium OH1046]|nr:glutamate-5-semialdehyde dehydrogenase [Coriobacteriales bacterium OH1046]